jgi:hypothetical protein
MNETGILMIIIRLQILNVKDYIYRMNWKKNSFWWGMGLGREGIIILPWIIQVECGKLNSSRLAHGSC